MTIHQIVDVALEERFPVANPTHLHDDILTALLAASPHWTPDLDVAYDEKWAVESFVRGFIAGKYPARIAVEVTQPVRKGGGI